MAKTKVAAAPANEAEKKVAKWVDDLIKGAGRHAYYFKDIEALPETSLILQSDPPTQLAVLRECIDRIARVRDKLGKPQSDDHRYMNLHHEDSFPLATLQIVNRLLRRKLPWTSGDLVFLINRVADLEMVSLWCLPFLASLKDVVETDVKAHGVQEEMRKALRRLASTLEWVGRAAEERFRSQLLALADGLKPYTLEPGEAWSDAALADLKKLKAKPAKAWNDLLIHCQTGGKGKFTDKWAKAARQLIDAVGIESFKEHMLRWFPLVDKPRTQPIARTHQWEPDLTNLIQEPHVELLRGLVWCCGLQEDADLARAVARLALSAYRKVPGKGPRLVSLGNACVTTLGMMPGRVPIGQLAILKVKVKFGTAQKEIEKAFNASAAREGLPRDEVEELAVPSYGLEEVGTLRESFGDYRAELLVDGSSAALHWSKDGKPIKSVPAAVKKEHGEEFKELQASLKDINAMLPAQRERIDTLFLAQKRWPMAVWKERYLDHPLVGTIARRLIWDFGRSREPSGTGPHATSGIWHDGKLVGPDGKPLTLKNDTEVSLWHPINRPMADVLAWRDWLDKREVIQPFKQAHREVYLLTDAERRTGTYSNRFAAHILRQHQFNALCAARGWKNKLRLMVDDSYPPAHRLLPQWNLRAEYWVEGAGSEYGTDTNESGVYLYLATDQVRFYSIDAAQVRAHAGGGGYTERWNPTGDDEPLSLDRIPGLVFSEIMRDVDLFVGVASVGNDPNWADGGPGGQYRDYWQSYSFGELSATAQTRRTLLERLIPRLKIKDKCSFTDRFLVVRGTKRTYKIHLGSGNILMEPNDQYLCIVPKQTVATAGSERVHLPFEGDGTLSIILSKAFLLADDAKITDPTITSQLAR